GISDFKRFFSRHMVTVGEEWVLEPHPLRTRMDRAISTLAKRLLRGKGTVAHRNLNINKTSDITARRFHTDDHSDRLDEQSVPSANELHSAELNLNTNGK